MTVIERDLDAIRWYVSNLRDVIAARPVRELSEAEGGYEASMERLADIHRGAAVALRAIATYAAPPHPEPCGTDVCLLCLIEGTAQNAIPGGR